ncbi:RagB/SusD family nutrient uptake outer membrane protein [Proteiniphilum acetatigenes]|uniref:RagB/SusD family nutrient uptake outer membrane protein n=1 Tax=Proteiniphilum acetatigenes TaxID=294710 RepID=UPI00035F98B0|nr:RagB/SusD family nutrient uptake outer membrane protein [Proteiniphilum acetatigenes]
MKHMIETTKLLVVCLSVFFFAKCSDYLNVVPDGVATLDNAFSNRFNSEKFLFSCYNMLPNQNDPFTYPGNVGFDEIWWDIDVSGLNTRSGSRIARNDQNSAAPFQNYWDGARDGRPLWVGIRDCNIFLNNIHKVPDLQTWERSRWISEVKFIKAYLHFFLLQLYGPIPIMDTDVPVNASPEEVRVYREPVEEVIEYIVNLLDESMEHLPGYIEESTTEMGRITKPIAASVKAKVLVWAASPLFNGNPDYANFKDNRDIPFFPTTADNSKWIQALEAIREAIDICHDNGHALYRYQRGFETMSDTTLLKYTLRGAVSERPYLNPEIIWAHPAYTNANQFQNYCTPKFFSSYGGTAELSATLKIAEQYYTKNGVPIDEDRDWDYSTRYETRLDTGAFHKYYIGKGETTAKLNYYREPRFYAHLAFDRSLYEALAQKEEETIVIKNRSGDSHGVVFSDAHISTGYFIKKLVSFRSGTTTTSPSPVRFSIPVVRLSDLYLLYAEALNETKAAPDREVYQWVDSIRLRAGLEGVVDSWGKYSNIPGKPSSKEGMREIIKRERMIELAFEGQRPFDLRRWKDAVRYMNQPVQGWDYQGVKLDEYYVVVTYYNNRNYTMKDYLWPLRTGTLIQNPNLVQNPGW